MKDQTRREARRRENTKVGGHVRTGTRISIALGRARRRRQRHRVEVVDK
jgi:hypothetical protein